MKRIVIVFLSIISLAQVVRCNEPDEILLNVTRSPTDDAAILSVKLEKAQEISNIWIGYGTIAEVHLMHQTLYDLLMDNEKVFKSIDEEERYIVNRKNVKSEANIVINEKYSGTKVKLTICTYLLGHYNNEIIGMCRTVPLVEEIFTLPKNCKIKCTAEGFEGNFVIEK